MSDTTLHQIRLHRMPDRCIGCNSTDWLPRRFRATTRELMHWMGHGTMRAALIYQHATGERDRAIADRLGALVEVSTKGARGGSGRAEGGPLVARGLHGAPGAAPP